jgi:hypothetical protein
LLALLLATLLALRLLTLNYCLALRRFLGVHCRLPRRRFVPHGKQGQDSALVGLRDVRVRGARFVKWGVGALRGGTLVKLLVAAW